MMVGGNLVISSLETITISLRKSDNPVSTVSGNTRTISEEQINARKTDSMDF